MTGASRPEIVIIAAVADKNRVIGKGLDLPWYLPEDLKRFKALTMGHPVVMGRRTFESVLHQIGGPLGGRDNVVLTRQSLEVDHANVHVYSSLEDALDAFAGRKRVFIGGGASVYEAALPMADRLELTIVEGDFEGDAFFPSYKERVARHFDSVSVEAYPAENGRPAFRFETYVRTGEKLDLEQ